MHCVQLSHPPERPVHPGSDLVVAVSGHLFDAPRDCCSELFSVADQAQALAELRRVLRHGGELRFYEHVVSHGALARGAQRVADATFWPRVAGGCHLTRDTTAAITAAGFEIEQARRFGFTPGPPVPAIPHVLGIARRVADV